MNSERLNFESFLNTPIYTLKIDSIFPQEIHTISVSSISRFPLSGLYASKCASNTSNSSQSWESLFYPDLDPPQTIYFPSFVPWNYSSFESPSTLIPVNLTMLQNIFFFPMSESRPGSYIWALYPEQIHTSWTENESELRITWVTYININNRLIYHKTLCAGHSINHDWKEVQVTTKAFNEGDRMIRVQYIHTAVITNLEGTCFYEYMVGNTCFWSEPYQIKAKTPDYVAPYDLESPANLIIIGDWGSGVIGQVTFAALMFEDLFKYDAILHIGDIAYELSDFDGKVGDDYLNLVQPVAAKIPYMTAPGNHETRHNKTHYKERFYMPKNNANQGDNNFYSFDLGPAHFVMFNTEDFFIEYLPESVVVQKKWLVEDLKQANLNRKNRPWVVVFGHRPLYCSSDWTLSDKDRSNQCEQEAELLQNELENIFYEQEIDIFFQAHVHYYERNTAIYKNQTVKCEYEDQHLYVNPNAPIYITNGNGGCWFAHDSPPSPTPNDYVLYSNDDFGYGRLTAYNATHFYYEQFDAEKLTVNDYFWIVKNRTN